MMRRNVPDGAAHQWTKEELAVHLEERFITGVAAGTLLPSERAMCETFGVSRPFVREVLSGLQQRGRIHVVPGRGAFVRDLDVADVARAMRESTAVRSATPRELIEARSTLERQTAALAAERATAQDLQVIERALRAFDEAEHLIERARCDITFHSLIARASHNPVLETMFGSIATLIFELMLRSLGDPKISAQGAPYHEEIFAAIRDGDSQAAADAMAGHIELAAATFGDDLDRSLHQIAGSVLRRAYGQDLSIDDLLNSSLDDILAVEEPA